MQANKELNTGRIGKAKPECHVHKFVFPPSKAHFFFCAFGKEYFLFVGDKSVFIVSLEGRRLEMLKTIEIP